MDTASTSSADSSSTNPWLGLKRPSPSTVHADFDGDCLNFLPGEIKFEIRPDETKEESTSADAESEPEPEPETTAPSSIEVETAGAESFAEPPQENSQTPGVFRRFWNWASSKFTANTGTVLPPLPGMLVVIGCQSRVGKDTFATRFVEKYPDTLVLSFAQSLYEAAFGIQKTLNVEAKKDGVLMQKLADLIKEMYGNDFFSKIVKEGITRSLAENPSRNIAITDLRHKVEFDMLSEFSFTTVRVHRPDRPVDRNANHSSETELLDTPFNFEISNDGDLEQFRINADATIDKIVASKISTHLEKSLAQ